MPREMNGIKRLKQEHLHGQDEENGDCLRAAVASILGFYRIDAVPHFCSRAAESSPEGWHYHFQRWLARMGYTTVCVPFDQGWVEACLGGAVYLLSGPSPRFPDELHVVIAYGSEAEVIHDPHPDGTGILPPNDHHGWVVDLLIPIAPARLRLEGTDAA